MAQYAMKTPAIVDFYQGEHPVNWKPVYRAILKASGKFFNGTIGQDTKVEEFVAQCKANKQAYGLYHFLLPNDITPQMNLFLSVINKVGQGNMPVCIDVECNPADYGISKLVWRGQIKVALDILEKALGYKPMIYTSKNFWDYTLDASGNPAGWEKYYPLWVAQYPYAQYVDSWKAPVLIPKGWTTWAIWQYAEDGRTQGYFANDLSTINDWYKTYLDTSWNTSSKPDIITTPYVGVTQKQGYLNGQKYYLQTIDLSGKQVRVRHFNGLLKTIQDTAHLDNAQIVVNGDDYVKGGAYMPTGMSFTDGKQYTPPFEFRYWLNISKDNIISYGFGQYPANVYNLTSFIRPLVVAGKLHSGLSDMTDITNTEIHARSILGLNAKGQLMILICEGFVNPTTGIAYAGVTLPQAAQLILDNGAIFAGEHGGGGDAQLYSLGVMVNESSDRDAGTTWRGVVQALEIFIPDGGNIMTDYFKIIGNDGANHTVRQTHDIHGTPVNYPNTTTRASITNTIGAESGATDSDIYVYPNDVVDSSMTGGFSAKKGDIWRKIYKVGSSLLSGWTAEIHLGAIQGITITPITNPVPPTTDPTFPTEIWLSMTAGGVQKKYILQP